MEEKVIQLQEEVDKLKKSFRSSPYGLHWIHVPEAFEEQSETKIPVIKQIADKQILGNSAKTKNVLIEGDNYHALTCLNYTHRGCIDLIYIDPPYNTGSDDFRYKDKRLLERFPDGVEVPKDHPSRHSYWLSFMEKRLLIAKDLLSTTGVILVHIDENELANLIHLMNSVFGNENDLGVIVWNKKNPKGDSRGVSIMHEYVLCYARNKEKFLELEGVLKRKKPNAVKMLNKAKSLFNKKGKKMIPDEVKEVIKPFNYKKEALEDFKVHYTLELINKEFQNWLSRQDFSNGEKAYKYIDEEGEVYRGVSMAWPNKKKAPDDYFKPLIHPITGLECPVPQRGWRNPPATMERLLKENRILFGENEAKQPERKYLLKENLLENTPSIYEYAGSDDKFFYEINVDFPYAKPVDVAKYFITSVHPNAKIVLDFFAGSGTTGHAVMELNKETEMERQFILVSNNENGIMEDACYPRLKQVMEMNKAEDKEEAEIGSILYYKTEFVGKHNIQNITDSDREMLADNAGDLIALGENTTDIVVQNEYYQIYRGMDKYTAIYFKEDMRGYEEFVTQIENIESQDIVIYLFSWGNEVSGEDFIGNDNIKLKTIPQPILEIYRQIDYANAGIE